MSLSKQLRRSPQLASLTLKTLTAAVFAATLMSAANGASLGRLTVLSALGQPLNAEIELTSVSRDEAGNLSARLASAEAFRQANIEFNPALYLMRFAIEQRGGRQVIRVTSAQPMNEPFVDMLLELGGTNSRLVREYTFLLDPADLRSAQVAVPAVIAPAVIAPVVTAPAVTAAASVPKVVRSNVESTPAASKAEPKAEPKAAGEQTDVVPAPRRSARAKSQDIAAKSGADSKSYTVKRGDSLARIANQVRSNGVSLDQMLVTIYRANPTAFVGANMNRMRAGQILTIPDADAASGVAAAEAHGVVVAQAADFANYRNKLAGQVSTSVPQKAAESGQSATGRISTKVEEQKNAANESKDKLKLSKSGTSGAPIASNTPAKAATGPTVEEQIAKDKAITEANSRVKELEKNVADLQKILELKNKSLAEQQKKAEAAPKPAPVATLAPVEKPAVAVPDAKTATLAATPATTASVVSAAPAASPSVSAAPDTARDNPSRNVAVVVPAEVKPPIAPSTASTASTASTIPPLADSAAGTTVVAPVTSSKSPKPLRTAAPSQLETSFMDDLMGNAFVLPGLGLILVAFGALGVVSSRRKKKNQQFEDSILTDSNLKANSLFGSTGGQSVDTNNSVFNSNFAPTASHLDANEVDPVAEADVYIAYGRDAQAEEILKEALKTQPERHAVRTKLLEIYATRKDTRSFDLMASELYGMTKGVGEDWEHAASMGAALDPNNPLYAGAVVKPVVGASAAFGAGTLAADGVDLQALLATTQHHDLPGEINTITPTRDLATPTQAAVAGLPNLAEHEIFALPVDHGAPTANAVHHTSTAADDGLDFDLAGLTLPEEKPAVPDTKLSESTDPNWNSLNFDMPATIASPAAALESNEVKKAGENEHHAVSTLLPASHDDGLVTHAHLDHGVVAHDEMPAVEHASSTPVPTPAHRSDPLDFDLSGISLDLNPVSPAAFDATHDHDLAHKYEPAHEPAHEPVHQPAHGPAHQPAHEPAYDPAHELQSHDTLVLEDESISTDPEMATKLDLAMAYEEIGDKEGARELLDEVIKGGSLEQVGKAKAMLSALG